MIATLHRTSARAEAALDGVAFDHDVAVRRWWCIGDPQASFGTFIHALTRHDLVDHNGCLRADVGLVSLGDHFDYGATPQDDPAGTAVRGREGMLILAWLCAHPRAQVRVLLGNHDAARVMELAHFDDLSFQRARAEAYVLKRSDEAAFVSAYHVPSSGILRRDFSTWTEAQRAQVQRLLLAGRYDLALSTTTNGRPLLLSHAGVTRREVGLLGLPADTQAWSVEAALQALLVTAVQRSATSWRAGHAGRHTPLRLDPVHASAETGAEAGGLLAHRPGVHSNNSWAWDPARPRRYVVSALPIGFDQFVGHTGGTILKRELATLGADTVPHGRVHTLHFADDNVGLMVGAADGRAGALRVVFTDAGLHHAQGDIEMPSLDDVLFADVGA